MNSNKDSEIVKQFLINAKKLELIFGQIMNIKTIKQYNKEYYEAINYNKIIKRNQCKWCLKILSSSTNYKKHIKSEKHKTKMELIKKEEEIAKKEEDRINNENEINKNLLLVSNKITKLEKTVKTQADKLVGL